MFYYKWDALIIVFSIHNKLYSYLEDKYYLQKLFIHFSIYCLYITLTM